MIYSKCKIKFMLIFFALINTAFAENITQEVAPDLKFVASRVYCSCGCGYTLDSCECDRAIDMVGEIETKLKKGESPDQILVYLESVYGQGILVERGNPVFEQKEGWDIGFPLQVLGFLGALYIAYKLGQRSKGGKKSREGRWELKERRR
jgi:cytochrome c-type biogenesis protein CcmH/NrfF